MSVPRTQLRLHAVTASLVAIQDHASGSVAAQVAAIETSNLESTLGEFAGAIKRIHGAVDFTNSEAGVFTHSTSQFIGFLSASSDIMGGAALDIAGNADVAGTSDLHGAVQLYSTLNVDALATVSGSVVEDLSIGRVALVGSGGRLVDDAQITHSAGQLTVSGSTFSKDVAVAQDLSVAGDVSISGDLGAVSGSFSGDVTISGNLIVSGDSVTVNVSEVLAEDNLITLNSGEVGAGVTAGVAGVEIDRGSADNALFQWEETADKFELKVGSAYADLKIDDLEAARGTFSSSAIVTGSLVVSGSSSSILAETLSLTAPRPAGTPAGSQDLVPVSNTIETFAAANGTVTVTGGVSAGYFVNFSAMAGIQRKLTFTFGSQGQILLIEKLLSSTSMINTGNRLRATSGSGTYEWIIPAGMDVSLYASTTVLSVNCTVTITSEYIGEFVSQASQILLKGETSIELSGSIIHTAAEAVNINADEYVNISAGPTHDDQAGTVNIGGGSTGVVSISAAAQINVGSIVPVTVDGSGDSSTAIIIGHTSNTSAMTLNTGTGGINIHTGTTTGVLNIGTGASTGAINMGTAGSRAITIGGTSNASALTLAGGTGGISISTPAATGSISIGADGSGAIYIGTSTGARAVNISTGASNSSVSIGTQAVTGRTISIGNTTGTTSLSLQAGSNGLLIGNNAGNRTITIGHTSNASELYLRGGSGGIFLNSSGGSTVVSGSVGVKLVSSAGPVKLADQYTSAVGSNWSDAEGIKLSNSAVEWADFESKYGSEVSLLGALIQGGAGGKYVKLISGADTSSVAGSTLVGADGSSSFSAKWTTIAEPKINKVDVFVNGAIMTSGSIGAVAMDYNVSGAGDITFNFDLVSDDVVMVVVR
jgi:fibronectin-binding autotransporter adhesin